MSAVVIATAYGGPDVLEIANQAPGEPGPGQALIEIRAAGDRTCPGCGQDWKVSYRVSWEERTGEP